MVATRRGTPRFAEATDLFEPPPPETQVGAIGVEGHRLRLRERFLSAGPEALADHEMLGSCCSPCRGGTPNPSPARLSRFGSFARVIAAPVQDLRSVEGIGEVAVVTLKSVHGAALRLLRAEVIDQPVLTIGTG